MKAVRKIFFSVGDYPGRTLKASINSIICFGWKVLGDPGANCINAWGESSWRKDINDDYAVCSQARKILMSADAIVTHNGKRFDLPFLNSRLMIHGLGTLPKIPHIDTCAVAKRNLFMYSNSLGELAKLLGVKEKIQTSGKDLWSRVAEKERKAMDEMTRYCKGDVLALEGVYGKLLQLTQGLPNYNLFKQDADPSCCPKCGSKKLKKSGTKTLVTRRVQQLRCDNCGGWCYATLAERKMVPL